MRTPIDPMIRFMRHVDKTKTCWLWTGTTVGTRGRYGSFRSTTRASDPKEYAHRWIYQKMVGPIPKGMEIDHICRNRLCVNPDHLEVVDHAENMRRARLATCRAGLHDLTDPSNIRWDEQGRRRGCKRCWLDRARERYQQRK
jgi:hypothetical protein